MLIRVAKLIRAVYRWGLAAQTRLYLKTLGVETGAGLKVTSRPLCRRHPAARIVIGRGVTINNTAVENPAGVTHRSILVAAEHGAELRIGNHVGLSGVTVYCARSIVIDDYVNIGANATVYDTDFHPIDYLARRAHDTTVIRTAPVRICSDAWIGANATILKGVTIGERSIVAAHAVVTKDVPADVVVAGVPARVVAHLKQERLEAAR